MGGGRRHRAALTAPASRRRAGQAGGADARAPATTVGFWTVLWQMRNVDQDFSLADMAVQFRSLRGDDVTFLTSPHLGSRDIDGESVVVSDKTRASALYDAMAKDKMADWAASQASPEPRTGG